MRFKALTGEGNCLVQTDSFRMFKHCHLSLDEMTGKIYPDGGIGKHGSRSMIYTTQAIHLGRRNLITKTTK